VKQLASALTATLIAATAASGQIVVDGTADANYGAALSTQNTDTQFGNSIDPDPRFSAGGSELDQVFGTVDGGFLYLTFAGNLETNFNKLEIFIDSEAGGQNTLVGANLPVAVDAFCCGGFGTADGALQRLGGFTFDAAFSPDYYLTASNGTESTGGALGVSGYAATVHYAELNNGPSGLSVRAGGVLDPFGDELDAGGVSRGLPLGTLIDQNNNLFGGVGDIPLHEFFEPFDALLDPTNDLNHRDMDNTIGLQMAVNQSNIAGVNGGTGATLGDPQNVTTGFEFAIPLAAIGNPTGDIKVTAFINGAGHDFASNQFSGAGILGVNPGTDGAGNFVNPAPGVDVFGIDLSTIAGDQFVTISQGGGLLLGDYNGDGFVGVDDLNLVLINWNTLVTPGNLAVGDGDGSGFIGVDDLNIVLINWNNGTPPASGAAIPEPASLALLGLGGMAMLRRRR
jgi:PEP-CTERM motif-containing protein